MTALATVSSLDARRARHDVAARAASVARTGVGLADLEEAVATARETAPDGRLPWLGDVLVAAHLHPALIGHVVREHGLANLARALTEAPA